MKRIIIVFLTMHLLLSVYAVEIDVISKAEHITLYHSGALVKRTVICNLKPGVNELVFKNISSKIVLNSLKINNKQLTILNKSIIKKLTAEEFNQLLDKKEAITKQITLIESKYSESGFITKVEELEKMTVFYSEKILMLRKGLRETDKKIEEARKLENTDLKNENAAILKLIVSVEGEISSPIVMQYVCGGIGWSPAYEISVENSSNKTIEVKYLAKAMSQTGEDWDDVVISLSSSFPLNSPTELPKPGSPWVLTGGGFDYNMPNEVINQKDEQQLINKLEGVEYQEISIPSFLKLRTLNGKYSLKSNSTIFTFPVNTVNLTANFYYYGFPGLDPETYLVASVVGWDTLGFVDGIANISYGGNNIGKSVIRFSESIDSLLISIGKDNSVFLKRSEIADQKYFKINSTSKKRKTTLAYQYELKNNNLFPVHFKLADQIPVSQTKYASVEMESTSNGEINNESGEIIWKIELKPGESLKKELIFTIEMDSEYKYQNTQIKKRYKTINCPQF